MALTTLFGALGIQAPPAAAHAVPNQVLAWNEIAYREMFVRAVPLAPPVAVLNFAITHAAVYDAVNAIEGGYQPYLGAPGVADDGDSVNAAVVEAAYRTLVAFVQSPSAQLETDYTNAIAHIREHEGDTATDGGVAVGLAAANAIIGPRSDESRTTPTAFSTGTGPGDWVAFSGNNFRWLTNIDPFLIDEAGDFATRGPRALGSEAYAEEFNEVKSLGRKTGSTRTNDQTQAALFWADHPIAMWTRMFQDLAQDRALSTTESSRFFAMLYLTGSDALIACFVDKELHGFWRPQTAIQFTEDDGNDGTVAEPGWQSLLGNPPYPDHPSGHNCISSSIVATLQDFFGTDRMSLGATSTPSLAVPVAITREFTSFSQVIKEIRQARVWGGLHFMSADAQGANLGRKIAEYREAHYFQPV